MNLWKTTRSSTTLMMQKRSASPKLLSMRQLKMVMGQRKNANVGGVGAVGPALGKTVLTVPVMKAMTAQMVKKLKMVLLRLRPLRQRISLRQNRGAAPAAAR